MSTARRFKWLAAAVVMTLGLAGCGEDSGANGGGGGGGGGGGKPQTATYTSTDNDGKTYTLNFTENTARYAGKTYALNFTEAAERYAAQVGDAYELTVGPDKSTGTVTAVNGNTLTLKPSNATKTFTVTVSGEGLTALNGTVTWTSGDEDLFISLTLTPVSSGGGDDGGVVGTWDEDGSSYFVVLFPDGTWAESNRDGSYVSDKGGTYAIDGSNIRIAPYDRDETITGTISGGKMYFEGENTFTRRPGSGGTSNAGVVGAWDIGDERYIVFNADNTWVGYERDGSIGSGGTYTVSGSYIKVVEENDRDWYFLTVSGDSLYPDNGSGVAFTRRTDPVTPPNTGDLIGVWKSNTFAQGGSEWLIEFKSDGGFVTNGVDFYTYTTSGNVITIRSTLANETYTATYSLSGNKLTLTSSDVPFPHGAYTRHSSTPPGGGMTWTIGTGSLPESSPSILSYIEGRFVVGFSSSKRIAFSNDGIGWTTGTEPFTASSGYRITAIAYGNGKLVVGSNSYDKIAYSTDDGDTWTVVKTSDNIPNNPQIYSLVYGDGKFVASMDYSRMYYSTDAIAWTLIPSLDFSVSAIIYAGGRFVVAGYHYVLNSARQLIAYSTDGINWTIVELNGWEDDNTIRDIAYGGGRYVAVGDNDHIAYSSDCINWTMVTDKPFTYPDYFGDPSLGDITSITYGNNKFVAVGDAVLKEVYAYSADGINWIPGIFSDYGDGIVLGGNNKYIAFGNNRFVVVGGGGGDKNIAYSDD